MPRKITVAHAAGFCFGVKKAIDKAEEQDEAYIFGSLTPRRSPAWTAWASISCRAWTT
jgi:hypothetical protein